MKERLDKFLSSQTVLSRKEAQKAIKEKRVTLNGAVIRAADTKVDTDSDTVSLDGKPLRYQRYVYYLMYKPEGVISATRDREEQTVIDLLPVELRRDGLFPAGRLDKDTTGLLILTDDGDYAHRMLSPKKHVVKRYIATLDREPDDSIASSFEAGVVLGDGTVCQSGRAEILDGCRVAVEIKEGKYHQIKRMFAALGYHVTALKRVRIGNLTLDDGQTPGEVRALTVEEAAKVFD